MMRTGQDGHMEVYFRSEQRGYSNEHVVYALPLNVAVLLMREHETLAGFRAAFVMESARMSHAKHTRAAAAGAGGGE